MYRGFPVPCSIRIFKTSYIGYTGYTAARFIAVIKATVLTGWRHEFRKAKAEDYWGGRENSSRSCPADRMQTQRTRPMERRGLV